MDQSLTCMITTQLWHHIYISGDLCDLPRWNQPDQFRKIQQSHRPISSKLS